MTKSDNTTNVYERLLSARRAFHKLMLKKTGWNDYSKYEYFQLEDFLIAGMDSLADHGLISIVSFDQQYARMTILRVDDPEDKIEITSPMEKAEIKGCDAVKNLGGAETYQRRYLWMAALEIVEHDALDAAPPKDNGNGKAKQDRKVSVKEAKEILEGQARKARGELQGKLNASAKGKYVKQLCQALNLRVHPDLDELVDKKYGIENMKEMTDEQKDTLVEFLENAIPEDVEQYVIPI